MPNRRRDKSRGYNEQGKEEPHEAEAIPQAIHAGVIGLENVPLDVAFTWEATVPETKRGHVQGAKSVQDLGRVAVSVSS